METTYGTYRASCPYCFKAVEEWREEQVETRMEFYCPHCGKWLASYPMKMVKAARGL